MRIINSLNAVAEATDPTLELWIYCGLDSCVTREVQPKIKEKLEPPSELAYRFNRAMLAPALDMMFRGVKIDTAMRNEVIYRLRKQLEHLDNIYKQIMLLGYGKEVNPRSIPQLKEFFYEYLGIPPITRYDKQTKSQVVTVNRDALEEIDEEYIFARPATACILRMRDTAKLLSVAETGVSADGRMRCTYNPAGTMSMRWSSSEAGDGTGTNLQNITDEMRQMFVADPGKKLGYVDLQQAESFGMAYISGDENYIKACNSGDLHTTVCKMVWPDLDWPDDLKAAKEKAEEKYYRHFSYRDMSKRAGHGSNYGGRPLAIAKHLKVDVELIKTFQPIYYQAFPGIPAYHLEVERKLAEHKCIDNPLGYRIYFFGRTNDDSTIKQAIASSPQSMIGQILNIGLWRVWKARQVELLLQVHDCIVFQFDDNHEAEQRAMKHVIECTRVPVRFGDKVMLIGADGMTGWNWRKRTVEKDGKIINPYGLMKWSPNVPDTRSAPSSNLLHRQLRQLD